VIFEILTKELFSLLLSHGFVFVGEVSKSFVCKYAYLVLLRNKSQQLEHMVIIILATALQCTFPFKLHNLGGPNRNKQAKYVLFIVAFWLHMQEK
jgi:hypothetical protein